MREVSSLFDQALQEAFTTQPPVTRGIRCGCCRQRHDTVAQVRDCYAEVEEFTRQQEAEIWAEDAWLRAAEAGSPDTWEEERIEALTEIYGYGPPPGFHF